MANKTAMQELIYWLKIGWKDEDVDTVIKKAEQLLEMEKEQIINAWTDGFMSTGEGWNGEIPPECQGQVLDNEEYYNKMFNLK
jgi:hypothetical protein